MDIFGKPFGVPSRPEPPPTATLVLLGTSFGKFIGSLSSACQMALPLYDFS